MSTGGRRHLVVEADGGSRGNPGPAGFGALVRDGASGQVLAERAGYLGTTTNNVAEYSGLVAGLRAAAEIDPGARVTVRMDSRLVVEQMSGRWQIKHDDMRRLAAEAAAVLPAGQVAYEWVPRAQNSAADALANEAMDTARTVARDYPAATGADDEPVPTAEAPADDEPVPTAEAPADVPGESAAFDTPARPSGAAVRFDDAPALTVVLVRHGQTPLTVAGAFSGSSVPGPSLTARGRTQAAQAADLVFRIGRQAWPDLPRPTAIVASPMVRAQETARVVGRRLGVHVTTDDRFAEVDFGEWEGLTAAEVDAAWPGRLHAWHTTGTTAAPGGESYADVGARVWHGLQHLVETLLPGAGAGTGPGGVPAGRTVVVVGHAVQVRAAIGTAVGAPPSRWSRVRVPPASVSILRLWADGTSELTAQGVPSDL